MALTTVPASLSATALTLTTAAQPNITSVGTLTGLTVSGTSTLGVVDASSFTDVITNTIYTQSSSLDIDVVLSGRDVTFTQGSTALMTVKGDASGTTVTGTLTGSDILLNDSGNNERSLRIQNSTVSSYLGVEGSSANRFVGSAANNMFLGTTTADGIEFATNNNVRAVIDSSGNVGIGALSPGVPLHIASTSQARLALDTTAGNTRRFDIAGDSNGFTIRDQSAAANRMTISTAGHVGIGTSSPDSILHVKTAVNNTARLILESTAANSYPYISFINDARTYGIYGAHGTLNSGDDAFTIYDNTAGAHRLTIVGTGHVGIGATSPTDYTYGDLVIDGVTGSGNASGITLVSSNTSYGGIFFADGTSGDEKYRGYLQYNHNHSSLLDMLLFGTAAGTRMVLSSAGKLGLGNTDPQGDIHLTHGSTNTFTPSNDSWHTIVLHNNAAAATNTTGIAFEVSGSGYHGNAGTGIAAVKNGTNSDYGAHLVFITRPQSAVAAERMAIGDDGRIYFGPDRSDIQIDPASTNSNNNLIYMRGNASGDKSEIQLNHYGHADYHIGVGHVANGTFNIANSQTGNDFVINTSGRVGIGKSTPSSKLHVVSTGSASYDATSSGTNIGLYLQNEESGAANRTIGMGLVCESNGEIYLNAVTNSINNGADFYIATRHAGNRRRRFQIMSDGRQINMNQAIVTNNEGFVMNLGFMPHAAAYGSGTTSGRYLHMKLTQQSGGQSVSGTNVMGRYEYKGFAYGGGFLHSGCSFYTYSGTSTPYAFYSYNQGHGNGMSAYYSTDNKVVIVVDIVANNYSGGVLYFQCGSTHYISDNQVASINYSANTTGVF